MESYASLFPVQIREDSQFVWSENTNGSEVIWGLFTKWNVGNFEVRLQKSKKVSTGCYWSPSFTFVLHYEQLGLYYCWNDSVCNKEDLGNMSSGDLSLLQSQMPHIKLSCRCPYALGNRLNWRLIFNSWSMTVTQDFWKLLPLGTEHYVTHTATIGKAALRTLFARDNHYFIFFLKPMNVPEHQKAIETHSSNSLCSSKG